MKRLIFLISLFILGVNASYGQYCSNSIVKYQEVKTRFKLNYPDADQPVSMAGIPFKFSSIYNDYVCDLSKGTWNVGTNSCYISIAYRDYYGNSQSDGVVATVVKYTPSITTNFGTVKTTDSDIPLSGTPTGGTWSGVGVTGNYLQPSKVSAGDHAVYYTYTYTYASSGDKCNFNVSKGYTVVQGVTLSLPFSSVCYNGGNRTLSGGSPSGGDYLVDGTQIPNGVLTPTNFSIGTHTVKYRVNGSYSTGQTLQIVSPPTVTLSGIPDMYKDDPAIPVSGGSPSGGTYYRDSYGEIRDLDPSTLSVGTHTVTYRYSNGQCENSTSTSFAVKDLQTNSEAIPSGSYCTNAGDFSLFTYASRTGGDFYLGGSVITNGIFSPSGKGAGSYLITYKKDHYTDEVFTITVNASPSVTLASQSGVCHNGTPVTLSGGSPSGGTYYINSVQATTLDPTKFAVGYVTVKYSYTSNGCTATATQSKEIQDVLNPSISTIDPLCQNASPVTLNQGTPSGGTYSIGGTTVTQLNPKNYSAGTVTVKYKVTNSNGCVSETSRGVSVLASPSVTLNPYSSICDNATPLTLTGGSPSGGTYSCTTDAGVVASGTFYPSLAKEGTYNIRYSYTGSNGCAGTADKGIAVLASTAVKLPAFDDQCSNGDAFALAGRGETPTGGTFYIEGSQVTTVDPVSLTPGTHTVTYKYTNANGCTSQDQKTVKINDIPSVTLSLPISQLCTGDSPINLSGGSPSGGTYYINGKAVTKLDPAAYPAGTIDVIYSYTSSAGCTATASGSILLKETPVVDITGDFNICKNASALTLTGATPTGGIYSVDGTAQTAIKPDVLNAGLHTLKYSYTSNGCTATKSLQFEVYSAPTATLILNQDNVCKNAGSFTLAGGTPTGGTYYVDDVTKSTFDPASQSQGNHTIKYEVVNSDGCKATDTKTLTVNPVTAVTFPALSSICENAAPLTLSSATPAGGDYTSAGGAVSGGKFYPSMAGTGTQTIRYTYTNSYGCTDYKEQTIAVLTAPTPKIPSIDPVCQNAAPFALTGATPTGGTYSIGGAEYSTVTPSDFTPGTYKVTYSATNADGCTATAETSLTVKSVTDVTLSDIPSLCENDSKHVLTEGAPSGGSYLFGGSSVTSIDPASLGAGSFSITYQLTNAEGCTSSQTKPVRIKAVTHTSISPVAPICQNGAAFDLSIAGPDGGTYTIDGKENTTFDPSIYQVGDHTIKYSYTNADGCTDESTTTATVLQVPQPALSEFTSVYLDDATFTLSGGSPDGGQYFIDGVANTDFNPTAVGEGDHAIKYQVTNSDGCTNSTTQPITVIPLKVPAIIPNKTTCANSKSFSLGALDGGAYYMNGTTEIAGGIFDPAVWGTGVFNIIYKKPTFSDIAFTVTVRDLPSVTIAPFSTICEGGDPVKLSQKGQPYGGTWSGTGVMGEYFTPANVTPGDYVVKYDYADSYGCTGSAQQILSVQALPDVSLQPFDDVCQNAVSFTLSGGQPSGGTYYVDGTAKTIFNPANYQPGAHEISYVFNSSAGCSKTVTQFINVIAVQTPALSDLPQICSNSSNIDLSKYASPTGGTFSCTNSDKAVASSTFFPSLAKEGTFTIRYTVNSNGCTSFTEKKMVVLEAPTVALAGVADICANADVKFLSGGTPSTGNQGTGYYSIDGNQVNILDPSIAGTGQHTLRYTFDASNGCSAFQEVGFSVKAVPAVTMPSIAPICSNASPVTLSGATPAGGIYYVNGQQASALDPTGLYGTATVSYKYDDGSGCVGTATQSVTINQAPAVNLSPITNFCENDTRIITLKTGFPTGGQYFVDDIAATEVTASLGAGQHTLKYTYADANNCSVTKNTTFTIYSVPEALLPAFDPVCENAASFALTGGYPAKGNYYVDKQLRTTVNPSVMGAGSHTIDYEFTTTEGCTAIATQTLDIAKQPDVTLTLPTTDFCQGAAPVKLTGGLPDGGTYSVDGNQTTTFEPTKAGTHSITYQYNDNVCSSSATALVYVNSTPDVSIEAIGPLCENDAPVPLWQGTPVGGDYFVDGVAKTTFDPKSLGSGNHTVKYSYKSDAGCQVEAVSTVVVNPLPEVKLSTPADMCQNADQVVLNTGLPSGGTYSVDGREQENLTPTGYQPGVHTLSYSYTDGNGCTNEISKNFNVLKVPSVSMAVQPSLCQNDEPVALTGGLPAGGEYTGESVINQTFYPAVGAGSYQVNYAFTNTDGCTGSATRLITVNKQDVVTLDPFQPVCQNGSSFTLSGGQPEGGTFYVNGVKTPVFIPSAYQPGTYTIRYEYTGNNECGGYATRTITVLPVPSVTISEFSAVCSNADPLSLSGASPSAGQWSGDGVMNDKFYPSLVTPGTHQLTYTFTNIQGCTSSVTGQILVNDIPDVSIPVMDPVCQNASEVFLTSGRPVGGTYMVDGAGSAAVVPSQIQVGRHTVTYKYTDGNGCTASQSTDLVILPVPMVILNSLDNLCSNGDPLVLSNGSPSGGDYYVDGDKTSTVNPSTLGAGSYRVVYSYTNDYGCSTSDSTVVKVLQAPTVKLPIFPKLCENSGNVQLTGATPEGGEWSGDGVTGGVFYNVSGQGSYTVNYTYTADNGCSDTGSTFIKVETAQVVSLADYEPMCHNADAMTLAGGVPSGGIYLVDGVAKTTFDPASYKPGMYNITYQFVNEGGCISTAKKTLTVTESPTVTMADLPGICPAADPFTITGGLPDGGNYFVNNKKVTDFNPASYGPGSYLVKYSYANKFGCTDTASATIQVYDQCPTPQLQTQAVYCPNTDISISLSNLTDNLRAEWFTVDGSTKSKLDVKSDESSVVLKSDKSFSAMVQYTDENGCKSATKSADINVETLNTNITTNTSQVQQGDLIQLFSNVDSPNNVKSYTWQFSDGTVSYKQNPWKYFNATGDIDVELYIETLSGCMFSQSVKDFITVMPLAVDSTTSTTIGGNDGSFGISDPDKPGSSIDVNVYPNPTHGMVNVMSNSDQPLYYRIVTMQGALIVEGDLQTGKTFNITGPAGWYILQIMDANKKVVKTAKIMKL